MPLLLFAVILSEPHEIQKSEDRTEEKNRHRKILDDLQHILNELQHILDELEHILDELQHILNELQHILDVPRSPFYSSLSYFLGTLLPLF